MMATYSPRGDGLFDVTLDTGVTVPMPLSEEQLQMSGATPAMHSPPAGPDMRTADLGSLVRPQLAPVATDASAPPPGVAAMAQAQSAEYDQAQAQARRPDPGNLVRPDPVGDGGGYSPAPAQQESVDPMVRSVFEQTLRGSGGPAVRIPAQDVKTSWQVKQGKQLAPGTKEELDRQAVYSDAARLESAQAQVAGRDAQASEMEVLLLKQQNEIDAARAQRARIDERIANASYLIRERQQDAENAKDINPNEWFEKNTFASVIGAIGIALGEYSRALTGGQRNIAKEMMDEAVNRNVIAQREKYERAKDKVAGARTAFADLVELHGSPERAEQELRLRTEALVDKRLELAAFKTGSQEIIANAQMDLAARREERALRWAQLEQSTQADIVENWQHRPAQVVGGGGGGSLRKALAEAAGAAKDLGVIRGGGKEMDDRAKEQQYGRVVTVNGKKFYAADGARAKEYQGVVEVYPQLLHNIERQKEIVRKGAQSLTPSDKRELEALAQRNKLHMKKLETLGAITQADQELVSPLVGEGASKFWSLDSSTERTLDAAVEHARMRLTTAQENIFHEPELNTPLRSTYRRPQ